MPAASTDTKQNIRYRVFISVLFGILGFLVNSQSVVVLSYPFKTSFMLGLLFPMIISFAWGWRYGLISASMGIFFQGQWLYEEGYPALIVFPIYLAWIVWHGWCAGKRNQTGKAVWNHYLMEIPFRLFNTLILYTLFRWMFHLNPPFWNSSAANVDMPISLVNIIAVIELTNGLIVLLMSDLLINLEFIRRILHLEIEQDRVNASQIVGLSILFGCFYWIIDSILDYLIFYPGYGTILDLLILNVPPQELFSRSAFIFACIFVGIILWFFLSQQLKNERALIQAEERFKYVVELSPYPIAILNSKYEFEYINPIFVRTFGYDLNDFKTLEEWIKLSNTDIESQSRFLRKWKMFFETNNSALLKPQMSELTCKNGDKRIVFITFVKMEKEKFFINIKDVTELKKAESQMLQMNETLEQRVITRTAELSEANLALRNTLDELKETQTQLIESEKMAALGNLVAGIAHEINTPIGIGVTGITYLKEQTSELEELQSQGKMKRSDLKKFIDTASNSTLLILSNLNRAAELVRSFKQVAVDQSMEDLRSFNVKVYLNEILNSLHHEFKRTGHTVTVDCPDDLVITNYPGAFYQVFLNLLMNSLIHGLEEKERGNIHIEVIKEGNIRIKVSDNGKGIPEEMVGRIFEPFFTTKKEQGGSGLGLHIVYNLVNLKLQGKIRCESNQGEGTAFIIEIPETIKDSNPKPSNNVNLN